VVSDERAAELGITPRWCEAHGRQLARCFEGARGQTQPTARRASFRSRDRLAEQLRDLVTAQGHVQVGAASKRLGVSAALIREAAQIAATNGWLAVVNRGVGNAARGYYRPGTEPQPQRP
jgi:hypothetical protein